MVLPASMRLKGHKSFELIHRSGNRFHGSCMVLKVVEADPKLLRAQNKKIKDKAPRCAVAISSKVSKNAVIRNRMRRLFHEHLRLRLETAHSQANRWALISLKPNSSEKKPSCLIEECDKLLHNSGLLSWLPLKRKFFTRVAQQRVI